MARVFLSYRQENDAHRAVVRALAERLENQGVTVIVDQLSQQREFHGGGPNEGWPKWSTDQAGRSENKVLIVGTPAWFRAFGGTEIPGAGLGSAAEAGIIRQRLYNAGGVNPDIRIVSFEMLAHDAVPIDLQRYHRFVDPVDFADLLNWINGGAVAVQSVEEWPATAPALSWVMANHDSVRAEFARLITRNPPFRYLPIRGASGTGKTHVTLQLLNNALRTDGLACGRFDFKGVTDADAEMQRFIQNLDIALPAGLTSIGRQFDAVLNALFARKRPTLLIFDTFEAAAQLDRWVKETLLVALVRQKWLRIVITGQIVPEPNMSSPWAAEALPTLVLSPPTADQWFDFSKVRRPNLSLDEVKVIHKAANGNSSLLAQILDAG